MEPGCELRGLTVWLLVEPIDHPPAQPPSAAPAQPPTAPAQPPTAAPAQPAVPAAALHRISAAVGIAGASTAEPGPPSDVAIDPVHIAACPVELAAHFLAQAGATVQAGPPWAAMDLFGDCSPEVRRSRPAKETSGANHPSDASRPGGAAARPPAGAGFAARNPAPGNPAPGNSAQTAASVEGDPDQPPAITFGGTTRFGGLAIAGPLTRRNEAGQTEHEVGVRVGVARLRGDPTAFPDGGVPAATTALATGLALAAATLASWRSGVVITVDRADVAAQVYLPLLVSPEGTRSPGRSGNTDPPGKTDTSGESDPGPRDGAHAPPAPLMTLDGAICADLGAEGDRETFERLLDVVGPERLGSEELARRAQEWRLPVTPYRRLTPATRRGKQPDLPQPPTSTSNFVTGTTHNQFVTGTTTTDDQATPPHNHSVTAETHSQFVTGTTTTDDEATPPHPQFVTGETHSHSVTGETHSQFVTGETHSHSVTGETHSQFVTGETHRAPLAGIKILDLTVMWSGPLVTWLLATLGAEVIKIEPACRPDGLRGNPAWFGALHRGKQVADLDLRDAAARDAFLTMATGADLVINNFSPRVAPNLGIDPAKLQPLNPDLINLAMPAFPAGTPERDWVAYGTGAHAHAGLGDCGAAGFRAPAVSYPDPIAGFTAAATALVALVSRDLALAGRGARSEPAPLRPQTPRQPHRSFEVTLRGSIEPLRGLHDGGATLVNSPPLAALRNHLASFDEEHRPRAPWEWGPGPASPPRPGQLCPHGPPVPRPQEGLPCWTST